MANNKNILLVSPFFYPEPISTGKYNAELVEGLVSRGCEVDVICSHSLYPDWKPKRTNEKIAGVTIYRGGLWVRYSRFPLLRRMILEIWFSLYALYRVRILNNHYAKVILIYPPSLVAILAKIYKSKGSQVIGIVHDVQGVMLDSNPGIIRRIVKKYIHTIERWSYNSCDKIIYLSSQMKSSVKKLYGEIDAASFIHHPFVTTRNEICGNDLDSIFCGKEKTLVYSGALGEKQSPDQMIRLFLDVLDANEEATAMVFSQGETFEHLKSSNQHDRLKFYPLVSGESLSELLQRSTVQVIPQVTSTSDGAFPSKLPNMIAARTKIFAVTAKNSEVENILSRYPGALISNEWGGVGEVERVVKFLNSKVSYQEKSMSKLMNLFSIDLLLDTLLDES